MEPQRANRGALRPFPSGRILLPVATLCLLSALMFAPALFGYAQPAKPKPAPTAKPGPGLRGILPDEVPDALSFEAFNDLGKSWEKWGAGVAEDLGTLYESEDSTAATQRKTIASIRTKLKTANAAIGDGSGKQDLKLTALTANIHRRLDIAEAILDTLEADPKVAQAKQAKAAWASLGRAVSDLESDLNGYANGGAWKSYVRTAKIRKAAADKNGGEPELANVAAKIAGRSKLSDKAAREFLSGSSFIALETAINGVLKAANAKPKTVNVAKLRGELKTMVAALETYDATSGLVAAGNARKAYDAASAESADGGYALGEAMRTHYFNYNFRIYVSESFMNRLIAETRTERRQISGDRVMEATIYGSAVTTAKVGVDLLPSRRDARFDILLTGATRSNTVGVTSQASIYTTGNHYFWARKEVRFDGASFSLNRPARISVSANNTTTGARTKFSGWPILGGFADNYAMGEARKRRGQSEAIARQKISKQVLPEFNKEVSSTFAKANTQVKDQWFKRIDKAGLTPDVRSVRTTNDYLLVNSRVMMPTEMAGSSSNAFDRPGNGVTVKIHESAMNNAFNRLEIAGKTLTEADLIDKIETSLMDVLGKDYESNKPKQPKGKKDPDKFVFDKHDPIRFRVRNGALNIIINAGLKRTGEEDIPPQIVTIPIKLSVAGKDIVMKRGTVSVEPAQKPDSAAKQIVRAGIMRKKIEDSIGVEKRSNTLTLGSGEKDKKPVNVKITKIRTANGWVTVWAQ